MSKKTPSPNDQRSNIHNPNSSAHKAAQDNRSRQLNPQDVRFKESRNLPVPEAPKKP